jgi:GTP-binding protein LepA
MDAGLEIIPIVNKIDLPGAEPDRRAREVADLLGIDADDIIRVSAKEGIGIPTCSSASSSACRRPGATRTGRCAR